MVVAAENVKDTLKKISSQLDDVEHRREVLIKGTRGVIMKCSKSIMALHRGLLEDAAKLLEEAQTELSSLRAYTRDDLERYLINAEQEFVEAYQLKCVYEKTSLAGIDDLNVATSSYILGLLDSIGEIKRMIYDNLRTERTSDALKLFALMEDLYGSIYPFAVYDNIVPGIKRKLDVAKLLIENARSTLTEESNRNLLIKRMDILERQLGS
ncbi:MAG TPA: RNA-binding protein [Nitrososphaeraceae archaeon]|nr:RNA-binding protein [Nitrososphaeraceae archaeon]